MGEDHCNMVLKARSWVNFGGLRGRNLRHLEMVRLGTVETLLHDGVPAIIGFNYSNTSSIEPIEFGYRGTERKVKMHSYSIDGPGGERIQTVQVAILGPRWAFKVNCTLLPNES